MNEKAFTILEVVGAIFILTVGTSSAFILISQTFSATSLVKNKLVAVYLVQEGIEIVRNIRETTWLQKRTDSTLSWDQYLPAGDWQADYLNQELNQSYLASPLNIDANGFYSYSPGSPTPFKRKISIEKIDLDGDEKPDKMRVEVEVSWQERGRTHNFKALEYVTNWYE